MKPEIYQYPQNSETEEIRKLVRSRIESVRGKDVAAATTISSSDLVLFDVVNPLQITGPEEQGKRLKEWLSSLDGPVGFEVLQLHVAANGNLGFSHGLCHVYASSKRGAVLDMYWRWTACFQKLDGTWKMTHEHNSVPFDPNTGKASLDLKP
jgi:ketosteroid isomerase-like protein